MYICKFHHLNLYEFRPTTPLSPLLTDASSPSSLPLRRVAENTIRPKLSSASPRSQINAKIRGSLSTLTASLEAVPVAGAGDGDLAARLARLRTMAISAPAGTTTIREYPLDILTLYPLSSPLPQALPRSPGQGGPRSTAA